MSEQRFLKASCAFCEGHIEFPAEGVGMSINCPHCGHKTVLTAAPLIPPPAASTPESADATSREWVTTPGPAPAKARSGGPVAVIATVVVVVLLVGLTTAGFLFYARQPKERRLAQAPPRAEPPVLSSKTEAEPVPSAAPTPAAVASAPKSSDDLKVGNITLEKAKGTSLIYAVGTLKNDSDHQRFGIKIELDLLDAKGERVGVAKDYRSTLEPRQPWRFRALVLDNRAVSAQVASLEEDQ